MLVKLTEVCGGNPTFIALRDQFTLKEVFVKMPKKHQSELWLFIGQFESTMMEGYLDE